MIDYIGVLLICDHLLVRSGLMALLSDKDNVKLLSAGGYEQAIVLIEENHPDLVVLDLVSNWSHGKSAIISSIIKSYPVLPLLVIANSKNDIQLLESIDIGVKGCLLNDSTQVEVYEAIGQLISGNIYFPALDMLTSSNNYREMLKNGTMETLSLSLQQKNVLNLVGQGFSNQAIAEQLFISRRTVEMHIYKIFKKLKVNNRTQAIHIALQNGLITTGDLQIPGPQKPIIDIKEE